MIAEGFADEETTEGELFKIADQWFPRGRSRDFHNALMDYAATEMTARKTGIKAKSTQSKFKGSRREKRGKILRLCVEKPRSLAELGKNFEGVSKKDLKSILEGMEDDG